MSSLNIFDYEFHRYLGNDINISGRKLSHRSVIGLLATPGDLYYVADPKYDRAYTTDAANVKTILENSRKFTAKPDALFDPSFDFTPEGAALPEPEPEPVAKPKPTPVSIKKADKEEPEPPIKDTEDAVRARARRERDKPLFGSMPALIYADAIYPGGTPNNYSVQKIPKCGKVHLEIMGADDLKVHTRKLNLMGISPPDYVLKDIQENVMPGIGLNVPLPFKRLYVGIVKKGNDVGGSHIATYDVSGFMYGVISMSPQQLVDLFGGYNSKSFGHALTHELAHFVDHTMLRNVDRMKFDQALRGKKVHPDSLNARTINTVPAEHFATLAELMVWGDSMRNVYTLNGIEVVSKYFENRYISQSEIDSRKV